MSPFGSRRNSTRTFRTGARNGVWFVTKDHVLYGDYLSRDQALRSACFAAQDVEAAGGSARVLAVPNDTVIEHRGFQFTR
jgi:hypothetical protein